MQGIVDFLNGIVWSNALVYLCLGTGIYFSFRTRFLQIRHLKDMVKYLMGGSASNAGVSSFQAFAMSVAGRVGTGNIAGVATAIAMGGPGAIFWMWAIAFLGAGSSFIECALGQVYKEEIDGEYRGGPAYYIEKGLGIKWYAVLFAVATVIAMGFFLPGVQSNSIASSVNNAFGISPTITGIAISALLALIIFGGVKRISKTTEIIVPFMAIGYMLIALTILAFNITKIPAMLALIFKSAFGLKQAFGGILGLAISWGVKRGIYSNEAGQGTGPQAAAAAEVSHPAVQGLVQAFAVYFDTLFVCSATAFMILATGKYNVYNPSGGFIVENLPGVDIGPAYTQAAVDTLIPGFGSAFVAIALFFFAFSTLIAYYYIAETNITYLFKKAGANRKIVINVLRLLLIGSSFYGAIRTASLAWGLGDIGVGIMAWLNVIAILILGNQGIKVLKDWEEQREMGRDIDTFVFDPKKLGLENADYWIKLNNKK
ncbi:alanine or glycine:cation symporter, AGCS family [Caminicella sporogenes DSM 14501]|uniref:Alanine or glycine:cation symporter, AGCS family n=1 Tax=Caminicella sporogenes DSM 14501 TaxID=1121266 RepID=A0A1M6Q8P8_9FIRM|nr:alanine/glycine:cation symporter family protein [Caminicella sporogenes]RKD23621.1 sodium:alanine symporter [Caminicella sporogenes]WIF93961.1 alanine/glycine:cation symporter family protein [Caminicella sporogenes]SHK16622.1 alanine or glycine:cation symporter, AGCS family [Caminicella sporogenes DSM 14501]